MLPCEDITTFHQKRCGSLLHLQDLKFKYNNIKVQLLVVRKLIGYRITDGFLREGPLPCTQQGFLSRIHFPRRNFDANIEYSCTMFVANLGRNGKYLNSSDTVFFTYNNYYNPITKDVHVTLPGPPPPPPPPPRRWLKNLPFKNVEPLCRTSGSDCAPNTG